MVPEARLLGHAAKTEQGWLCQVHHQPAETMKEGDVAQFPHQGQTPKSTSSNTKGWRMVKVRALRNQPDNSIKKRLVLAVLDEDGQKVTLQDLGCPQLLPHIASVILVPQVADQILHTLFRDRINTYKEPWKKLHPCPQAIQNPQLEKFYRPPQFKQVFYLFPQKGTHLSNPVPCGKCLLLSTQGHYMWLEVHNSSCTSPYTSGPAKRDRYKVGGDRTQK